MCARAAREGVLGLMSNGVNRPLIMCKILSQDFLSASRERLRVHAESAVRPGAGGGGRGVSTLYFIGSILRTDQNRLDIHT